MGYIQHDAIVVTSNNAEAIQEAACKAKDLGLQVLGPSVPLMNGYQSLLLCPDGSKEGWKESNKFNELREAFIVYLRAHTNLLDWVALEYSDDGNCAKITEHAWDKRQ
jgi:hypothetical protein